MSEKRILIVEDEADVSLTIKTQLESNGYSVTDIADTADRALQSISTDQPDLILMDINLKEDTSGVDCAKEVKKNFDIPIIFLTGLSDSNVIKEAVGTGPNAYLVKPYREEELLANVELALANAGEDSHDALARFFNKNSATIDELLKDFAVYLKEERKKRKLTQVQVAEELDINYRHFQNIEAGKINLRMETFHKLMKYFEDKDREA